MAGTQMILSRTNTVNCSNVKVVQKFIALRGDEIAVCVTFRGTQNTSGLTKVIERPIPFYLLNFRNRLKDLTKKRVLNYWKLKMM